MNEKQLNLKHKVGLVWQ